MPDLPSRRQTIVFLWKRWRKNPIVAVLVSIVTLFLGDIITTPFHPITSGLLNMTWQSATSANMLSWAQQNSLLICFFIVSIVVGILAQWQVNRAQDKTSKVESELKEAETRAKRDIQKVYESSTELLESERNRFEQESELERTKAEQKVISERIEFKRQLQSERDQFIDEITTLVKFSNRLKAQLSQYDQKRDPQILLNAAESLKQNVGKQVFQAAAILFSTIPEDALTDKATKVSMKYKEKK
jgi:uncharacterized membrane-anchored protein YhcB (DUF1043 family)